MRGKTLALQQGTTIALPASRVPVMQTIHILDNRDDCNARLQKAVSALGGDLQLRFWPNGNSLIAGCAEWFPNAAVLSLNCEPDPRGETVVTGTALDLARFIGDFPPVCPVVIHSSNAEGARAIIKELRSAHWMAEHIAPLGADWIERRWLSRVRTLLDDFGNTWFGAPAARSSGTSGADATFARWPRCRRCIGPNAELQVGRCSAAAG